MVSGKPLRLIGVSSIRLTFVVVAFVIHWLVWTEEVHGHFTRTLWDGSQCSAPGSPDMK